MKLRDELYGEPEQEPVAADDDGDIFKALWIAVPVGIVFWSVVAYVLLRVLR